MMLWKFQHPSFNIQRNPNWQVSIIPARRVAGTEMNTFHAARKSTSWPVLEVEI
jgi:hypothetical protein